MKAAKTRALNAKHAGTGKHQGTGKHSPTATKRAPRTAKQTAKRAAKPTRAGHLRAFGSLPCCSHEAVAASARLAGYSVADADVLALFARTDGAASIPAALEAALAFGLGGIRPLGIASVAAVLVAGEGCSALPAFAPGVAASGAVTGGDGATLPLLPNPLHDGEHVLGEVHPASVILGLDLPEAPHAVTLDPSGAVWSWGGLHEMTAEAVIEEAWAVVWP